MNLNDAALGHIRWKARLRHLLSGAGAEELSAEHVENDAHCDLGRWIHGEGARLYASHPEYERLRQVHAAFHLCAGRVVALTASGRRDQAEQLLADDGEFSGLSAQVADAIDACKKIISAEPDYRL